MGFRICLTLPNYLIFSEFERVRQIRNHEIRNPKYLSPMKLLHTADWHLGQKFINQNRDAEHAAALDWLLQTIEKEQVELLIVAGDVFDVNNPPVSAEEIYYRFLTRLIATHCRHVVIVGGNHDLPSRLNAPSGLLKALDVHVVGCAGEDISEEVLVLREKDGTISTIVAAVPFLRDKDFKISVAGESTEERITRIKSGIYEHYRAVAEACAAILQNRGTALQNRGTPPLIVTGHLYAKGASSSGEQNNIYIGNLENIAAEQFPEIFDYVALGHIHRPQIVGKKNHIRYSGSLIPLSFSELQDNKVVLLVDFEFGAGLKNVREIEVPKFRKLISIKGKLPEVELKLTKAADPESQFPVWAEVVVESEGQIPNLDLLLREKVKDLRIEILKIKNERKFQSLEDLTESESLDNLSPEDVFRKKIETLPEFEQVELTETFRELAEGMI